MPFLPSVGGGALTPYLCCCLCVRLCPSAMTLKWHNIVTSKYIAIQLYSRVDITRGTLISQFDALRTLEKLHS